MKRNFWLPLLVAVVGSALLLTIGGCGRNTDAQSVSGVKMAIVGKVDLNEKGHTVEQQNVIERIKRDNEIGALKHLYVISPYSGQVILYSPVKGKVTSGGKRLTPRSVAGSPTSAVNLPTIVVGGITYYTNELANEDGTYGGGDAPYLYWSTPDGKYHQHYLSGGAIVHVSDQPIPVKGVIITVDGGEKK